MASFLFTTLFRQSYAIRNKTTMPNDFRCYWSEMKVTVQQLRDNGADLSKTYIYKLSSPIAHIVKCGYVESVFDTDKIKKGISCKRLTVAKSLKTANVHRIRMEQILSSIEVAIERIESEPKHSND